MNTKRKVWFSIAVVVLMSIGNMSYLHWLSHRKVIVNIGPYPTLQAEQRAALQRLSAELYRHPEARAVQIKAGKSAWRQGVMGYIRTSSEGLTNAFWYDDRFSSPTIGYVNGKMQGIGIEILVSEEPIHLTAKHNGTASAVDVYNEPLRRHLGYPSNPPAHSPM